MFDSRRAPPDYAPILRRPRGQSGRRVFDEVALTEPRQAMMRLIRQRVLENTRLALGLERRDGPNFALPPTGFVEAYIGRLLGEQTALAGGRADWEEDRLGAALEEGLMQGLMETLDILYELDELDEAAWSLVCGVQEEFYRRHG